MTADVDDLTEIYRAALGKLALEQGVDAALSAAATTIALYCGAASRGLLRRREPVLLVPADTKESESENAH